VSRRDTDAAAADPRLLEQLRATDAVVFHGLDALPAADHDDSDPAAALLLRVDPTPTTTEDTR
jgi:hypothetical protein